MRKANFSILLFFMIFFSSLGCANLGVSFSAPDKVMLSSGGVSQDVVSQVDMPDFYLNSKRIVGPVKGVSTVHTYRMPSCNLDEDDVCSSVSVVRDVRVQEVTANMPNVILSH